MAEGTASPLLFQNPDMINETLVKQLAEEAIQGSSYFLVEVAVNPGAKINIELDSPNGITIEEVRKISRQVESGLDRDKEDFELTVSSPGLEKPFRVFPQYLKNVGRKVSVELNDGKKLEGQLLGATEVEIEVETKGKEKVEGKKSKQEVIRKHAIKMSDIKQTKVLISFK